MIWTCAAAACASAAAAACCLSLFTARPMCPCCACSSFAIVASSTLVKPKRSANCKRTSAIFGSSPAAGMAGAVGAGTAGAAGAAGAACATGVACTAGVAVCAPAVVAAAGEGCRVALGGVVGGAASKAMLSLLRCLATAGRRSGASPPSPLYSALYSRRSYVPQS